MILYRGYYGTNISRLQQVWLVLNLKDSKRSSLRIPRRMKTNMDIIWNIMKEMRIYGQYMDDEAGKMNGHHMDDNGGNVYVVEMCEELNGPYGERAKPQIRELVLVGPKGRTLPGKEEEEPYGY
ncbi:hypothetical protein ACET3Z_001850 [Daucus carota]